MAKVSNTIIFSKVPNNVPHIRFDYDEAILESTSGVDYNSSQIRCFAAAIGSERQKYLDLLVGNITNISDGCRIVQREEGPVANMKSKYEFLEFLVQTNPLQMAAWEGIRVPIKRDKEMFQRYRKGESVWFYVDGIYNRNMTPEKTKRTLSPLPNKD